MAARGFHFGTGKILSRKRDRHHDKSFSFETAGLEESGCQYSGIGIVPWLELAADIVQNTPQVGAVLGGGEVQEVKVKVVGDEGTVTIMIEMGLIIAAKVDLESKKVITVGVTGRPELNEAAESHKSHKVKLQELARITTGVREYVFNIY